MSEVEDLEVGENGRVAELERQLQELRESHAREMAALRGDPSHHITVQVQQPIVPRPRIFTGLPPKGGNEVGFPEWEQQTEQLLSDPSSNSVDRVRSSLRGLALEQTKDCQTTAEILNTLHTLYGVISTTEDLYEEFCSLPLQKAEQPSQFLLRLWDKLLKMNKTTKFSDRDCRIKLYRAFMKATEGSHTLLCLELRNRFGYPGVAEPSLDDLLTAVRRLEGAPKQTSRSATAHVALVEDEELVDRIAAKVAARLQQASISTPPVQQPAVHPPPRAPRGPCYRCGEVGHIARNCRAPPNSKASEPRLNRPLNSRGPANRGRGWPNHQSAP